MTVKECFLDIVPFIINECLLLLVSLAEFHEILNERLCSASSLPMPVTSILSLLIRVLFK